MHDHCINFVIFKHIHLLELFKLKFYKKLETIKSNTYSLNKYNNHYVFKKPSLLRYIMYST